MSAPQWSAVTIVTGLCPSPCLHLAQPLQVHLGIFSLISRYSPLAFFLFLQCTMLLRPSGNCCLGLSHLVTYLLRECLGTRSLLPQTRCFSRAGTVSFLSFLSATLKVAIFVKEKKGSKQSCHQDQNLLISCHSDGNSCFSHCTVLLVACMICSWAQHFRGYREFSEDFVQLEA